MLDKVLDKIKKIIDFEKLNDTKMLIETDDKLSDYIILKNVVILIMCDMTTVSKRNISSIKIGWKLI